MILKDQHVLVFGTGSSGIDATKLLEHEHAEVLLYDGNKAVSEEQVRAKLSDGSNARIVIGALADEDISWADLVVLSPGVPLDIPDVCRLKEAGLPIWGEIELAYRTGKGDVLAITGTNGKTTTTALLGQIMSHHAQTGTEPKIDQAFVVGNIGTPYTSVSAKTTEKSAIVLEISSFQLETVEQFHPRVSAITNITPDHLNRHHTMEEYIRVKERICENQTPDEVCVLNADDPVLRSFGQKCSCRVIYFSSGSRLDDGFYYEDGAIFQAEGGHAQKRINVDELQLLGVHNYENVMTAMAMAYAYGVDMEEICKVCREFTAVEHRIEFVAEKNGVAYYNDSKGTNPDAAIRAVRAMNRPTVLLGGGYDKGSSYGEWIDAFDGKVKALVLVGQTKEAIAKEAREHGFSHIFLAETFDEAFAICVREAADGDAVLLSPACASWGMFPNYEVRGRVFKELVRAL